MKIKSNSTLFMYLLALLIPFLYFLNLNWDANSPVNSHETMNVYFGADVVRTVDNLEDNGKTSHYRDRTHPYFSIIAVSISKTGIYLGFQNLAFPIYKMIFGTFGVFLFWLFIYKSTNALQAFASLALLLSAMSFRVWTALPETFLFSFFSLMVALNLMRLNVKPEFVLLSTLAGTVTNLFFGLAYLAYQYKNKSAILKILASFTLMAVIGSIVQQNIYPTSAHFFDVLAHKEELGYIVKNSSSSLFRLFDFLISGFIVPLSSQPQMPITTSNLWYDFFNTTFTASKRTMLLTVLTLSALTACYLLALQAYITNKNKNPVNLSIFIFILFELLLHLVYGDDPFLYSLNFTPLIIIFMSLNQSEKLKPVLPHIFVFLAFLVQRFNFSDPGLFTKYFL